MTGKRVVIAPPTAQQVTRVAKALYAAVHVDEGLHGRTISPWSTRLDDDPHSRRIWEGLAVAAIDLAVGHAARI